MLSKAIKYFPGEEIKNLFRFLDKVFFFSYVSRPEAQAKILIMCTASCLVTGEVWVEEKKKKKQLGNLYDSLDVIIVESIGFLLLFHY